MIKLFNKQWNSVPTLFVDVETTGVIPGQDTAVQVALVRFESGAPIATECSLLNPGRPIPEAATAIHGITDEHVRDAPSIGEFFERASVRELLAGAQPGAYNATFDRAFVPLQAWGEDWGWQWLDPLTFVRAVDRFVRGQGRHKLEAACQRRGIEIPHAHDAAADAEAAGRLLYKVVPEHLAAADMFLDTHLGNVLREQRIIDANESYRFFDWLSKQPPREESRQ